MTFTTLAVSLYPQNTHAGVLSFVGDLFGGNDARASNIPAASASGTNSQTMSLPRAPLNSNPTPTSTVANLSIVDDSALETSQGPGGTAKEIQDKQGSDTISVYTVRPGDTLSEIAFMFDVSPNTVLWANDLKSAKDIHPGDQLIILPISGLKYTVKKGDTLKSIAKITGGDVTDIISYNDLAPGYAPKVGEVIIVPDGVMNSAPATSGSKPSTGTGGSKYTNYSGYFIKPTAGIRTQGLHGKYRTGVDFGASIGTSIKASAAGRVLIAKMGGYNGGYGNYIVIQHANGLQTLYAHLSGIDVSVGTSVSQGQLIGRMGNSGNSTGSHLHFEIWGGVRSWNPFQ
ncbi:MAG: M23 family metallopeptidase [Candidatus Paceibacterota bacterium]|jgi:LysM repeat protein